MEKARWGSGFTGCMVKGSLKPKLEKGAQSYGPEIADFPLLKIRAGVYFPFTNTVIRNQKHLSHKDFVTI